VQYATNPRAITICLSGSGQLVREPWTGELGRHDTCGRMTTSKPNRNDSQSLLFTWYFSRCWEITHVTIPRRKIKV